MHSFFFFYSSALMPFFVLGFLGCHTSNTNNFTVCRKGHSSVIPRQLRFTVLLQAHIPANHTRNCIPQRAPHSSTAESGWQTVAFSTIQHHCLAWYFSRMAWCLRHEVNITWCLAFSLVFTFTMSHRFLYLPIFANPYTYTNYKDLNTYPQQ